MNGRLAWYAPLRSAHLSGVPQNIGALRCGGACMSAGRSGTLFENKRVSFSSGCISVNAGAVCVSPQWEGIEETTSAGATEYSLKKVPPAWKRSARCQLSPPPAPLPPYRGNGHGRIPFSGGYPNRSSRPGSSPSARARMTTGLFGLFCGTGGGVLSLWILSPVLSSF